MFLAATRQGSEVARAIEISIGDASSNGRPGIEAGRRFVLGHFCVVPQAWPRDVEAFVCTDSEEKPQRGCRAQVVFEVVVRNP